MPEDNIDGTREETLELSLDDLDEVAGGYIFSAPCAYEVLNHNGDVVERFPYCTAKQKKIAHERPWRWPGEGDSIRGRSRGGSSICSGTARRARRERRRRHGPDRLRAFDCRCKTAIAKTCVDEKI